MPAISAQTTGPGHTPVLLQESIEALNLQTRDVFLDGTLGSGGHSLLVAKKFKDLVTIIGLDQDAEAIKRSEALLQSQLGHKRGSLRTFHLKRENFKNLDKVLRELKIEAVDAILFDLGISTDQLEQSGRGFSFLRDEPLDMRMSGQGLAAKDLLNSWDKHAIELILYGFGEERDSKKIAEEIVRRRKNEPFQTTFDLVKTVLQVKHKSRRDKIHPATKTFQAVRIAVNEELTNLEIGLEKGFKALRSKGRFVVISFHSLEDRIVKNFFRDKVKKKLANFIAHPSQPRARKPITPSPAEVAINPRARSAKLRVIEKI